MDDEGWAQPRNITDAQSRDGSARRRSMAVASVGSGDDRAGDPPSYHVCPGTPATQAWARSLRSHASPHGRWRGNGSWRFQGERQARSRTWSGRPRLRHEGDLISVVAEPGGLLPSALPFASRGKAEQGGVRRCPSGTFSSIESSAGPHVRESLRSIPIAANSPGSHVFPW
jgi:hypothetical protein